MLPEHTIDALRLVSLPLAEMLRYLPPYQEHVVYEPGDSDSDDVPFPAQAALHAAFKFTNGVTLPDAAPEGLEDLLRDLSCVMYIMLDAGVGANYVWVLNGSVSGPYDGGWDVLRRLGLLALAAADLRASPPTLDFLSFIQCAGFRRIRVVREPS